MAITGTGTSVDPYMIYNVTDLQAMGTYSPTAYYKLANDIDASDTVTWNSGSGFAPLHSVTYFAGTLDGGSYSITGLHSVRPGVDNIALFAQGSAYTIKDLTLADCHIHGKNYVAGLVSYSADGGLCSNVVITNPFIVVEQYYCGGIIANSYTITHLGTFSSCRATGGTIQGSAYSGGNDSMGGIAGYVYKGVFTSCYTTTALISGSVSVGASDNIGGLVGYIEAGGTLTACYSSGSISVVKGLRLGGLIGYGIGISGSNCYSSRNITSTTYGKDVGGLIGKMESFLVTESYAIGNIAGTCNSYAESGGFIGYLTSGSITNCYAKGNVIVDAALGLVGGFAGGGEGVFDKCYSAGTVTNGTLGTANDVGGFIGYPTDATITKCYFDATTSGQEDVKATGKTTAQMKTQSTFTDWDFGTIWGIY